MQDNDKYRVINTKVDVETYNRIKHLERTKKINIYRFGQMFWQTVVSMMDDRHNLTPEMERLIQSFEYFAGWNDLFRTTDQGTEKEIAEAVYFICDKYGKMKSAQLVHVRRPFMGDWKQDYNVSHIVERVLEVAAPQRYRRMRMAMGEMECENLMDFIDRLLAIYKDDERYEAIRQEFEDAARAENGKPLEYGTKTVSKQRMTMDMFEAQYQKRKTVEEQNAEARQWLAEHPEFNIDE